MTDELTYFKGTHRVIAPEKTIENNEDKLKTAGITRIADITDLDRIGLPIYTAIRPTAEDGAVSIYGGKGIAKDHASIPLKGRAAMKLKSPQWRRFPNWESS